MCVIEVHPRLETRRLVLRAPEARDTARIAQLAGEWDIARMTTRMPYPYGVRDAEAFLATVHAQDPKLANTFLIEHEAAGPVGMVGLYHDALPYPELGYWIGKPFWGRGFATEAVEATLDWTRRRWNKRVVAAGHFADNAASGRVLDKAGFLYTGEVARKFSRARGEPADTRMMVWLA